MADGGLFLHELSFVPEGDDVVVGRLDTGSYAVFPADGAELLKRLAQGMPLGAAADWYESVFDEPVDLDDFVATLEELGFVREDGEPPPDAAPPAPVRLRRLGRAVFSLPAWGCYLAVAGGWAWAVAGHTDLAPHPSQIFFVHSLLVVQLVITFGQVPLLLLHEGFHILAGRRLGLPTRLRLSNRLTYIVAETQINGLLSVPRRKRYLPFLAGIVCDGVVMGALGLVADATRNADGTFSLTARVCLALAFTVGVRVLWQFQLYLRTDLYYVAATAWNCYDLHDAGMTLLKNRMWRLLGRSDRVVDEEKWTPRDRRVGKFYGPFIVLGYGTLAGITAFVSIPVTIQYFTIARQAVTSGHVNAAFWDAVLSLCMNIAQVAALVVLSRRKRREKKLSPSHTSPSTEVELA